MQTFPFTVHEFSAPMLFGHQLAPWPILMLTLTIPMTVALIITCAIWFSYTALKLKKGPSGPQILAMCFTISTMITTAVVVGYMPEYIPEQTLLTYEGHELACEARATMGHTDWKTFIDGGGQVVSYAAYDVVNVREVTYPAPLGNTNQQQLTYAVITEMYGTPESLKEFGLNGYRRPASEISAAVNLLLGGFEERRLTNFVDFSDPQNRAQQKQFAHLIQQDMQPLLSPLGITITGARFQPTQTTQ